ncbi:MAG: hypothetical protein C4542_02040 [Dehalococcoidia bacterium]|nr:MAG: hypothetical protein C4542_02040 [Dehalococcoidia bacterium]
MDRTRIVLLIIAAAVIGACLGVLGHWYFTDIAPAKKTKIIAQKQMEQMKKMVRTGEVTDVTSDSVTLEVKKSGDDSLIGQKLTFKIGKTTTVQAGMNVLNRPDEAIDLGRYVKAGMTVDVLAEGDRALAVHWEAPFSSLFFGSATDKHF